MFEFQFVDPFCVLFFKFKLCLNSAVFSSSGKHEICFHTLSWNQISFMPIVIYIKMLKLPDISRK